ncbi:sex peptide receptor isoform X2 [Aplysia californica]|uniref:Sex peptide receptor isoform X2 n=1 Tax=Aplysia californica TaxID=6500 RepID=A0ABM0K2I0_APLCA|nr:sex peptide receptor isoform X2 [Aplysia californica]
MASYTSLNTSSVSESLGQCTRLCVQLCIRGRLSSPPNMSRSQYLMECVMVLCSIAYGPNDTLSLIESEQALMASNESAILPADTMECNTEDRAIRLKDDFPKEYSVPINGYASPVLIFLTVINNLLVCIVLLKPHMRSPTNAILVAMALSDMFTGIFPAPMFIHFFATERFDEWMPYEWCFPFRVLHQYIPTIFHTASIWLTMALAVQRYIYVCHSFKARTWCTVDNVVKGTIAIYVVATLTHFTRFFVEYPVETSRPSILNPNVSVSACVMKYRPWAMRNLNVYFNIYYWFRVIFIHLVPCVSLVVMNALLIYTMRVARRRRMQLLRQNKKTESRKLKESNCTTLMLVAVVGLFLLVEFPLGLLMVFLIIDQTFHVAVMRKDLMPTLSLFSNFFILLSYPLNFFIYCGMSKQFRETFKRLFTGADMPVEREYSQYMTLPTENGKNTKTSKT